MAIKQNMDKPIFSANNGRVYAIADEANDGIKAVPAELVVKAADDSTFTQISESNPLPVKMDGVELSIDPNSPLPVTGEVQLTGSNVEDGTPATPTFVKDDDGNSVTRVVDAAPFAYNEATDRLKVENININPRETKVYQRYGELAAATTELVADVRYPCEMTSLTVSCSNAPYPRLLIRPYNADGTLGNYMGTLNRDGSNIVSDIRVSNLNLENTQDIWEVINFNEDQNRYAFRLIRPLKFNNGVLVEVRNGDSSNIHTIACETVISSWE